MSVKTWKVKQLWIFKQTDYRIINCSLSVSLLLWRAFMKRVDLRRGCFSRSSVTFKLGTKHYPYFSSPERRMSRKLYSNGRWQSLLSCCCRQLRFPWAQWDNASYLFQSLCHVNIWHPLHVCSLLFSNRKEPTVPSWSDKSFEATLLVIPVSICFCGSCCTMLLYWYWSVLCRSVFVKLSKTYYQRFLHERVIKGQPHK